jgi:hypothetical protein
VVKATVFVRTERRLVGGGVVIGAGEHVGGRGVGIAVGTIFFSRSAAAFLAGLCVGRIGMESVERRTHKGLLAKGYLPSTRA